MQVSQDDAVGALRDIEQARDRSATLFMYQLSSPHLLVWGTLWIFAALLSQLWPSHVGEVWFSIDALGILASGYFGYVCMRRASDAKGFHYGARYAVTVLSLAAFVTLTFAIFTPVSGAQVQTFITLMVAVSYIVVGTWIGARFALVGLVVGALATIAFFLAPSYASVISAGLGGGALIVGGLWMRRT